MRKFRTSTVAVSTWVVLRLRTGSMSAMVHPLEAGEVGFIHLVVPLGAAKGLGGLAGRLARLTPAAQGLPTHVEVAQEFLEAFRLAAHLLGGGGKLLAGGGRLLGGA